MTEEKNKINKETIWLAVMTVLPAALLWPTSHLFAEPGLTRTLISGVLGGIGALIGFGLYNLVKTKSDKIKVFTTIGVLVACVGFMLTVDNFQKQNFETCEVCGYKAVDKNKQVCNYCASPTWEKEKSSGNYNSKNEWLTEQQLFWFSLDSLTDKANFYEPAEDQGYKKDKTWMPIISQKDLEKDL